MIHIVTLFIFFVTDILINTEISQEEKEKIFASSDFKEFFDRATRVVDRALYMGESLDIMEDFRTEDNQEYIIFSLFSSRFLPLFFFLSCLSFLLIVLSGHKQQQERQY
jgi:hypothetical protein